MAVAKTHLEGSKIPQTRIPIKVKTTSTLKGSGKGGKGQQGEVGEGPIRDPEIPGNDNSRYQADANERKEEANTNSGVE